MIFNSNGHISFPAQFQSIYPYTTFINSVFSNCHCVSAEVGKIIQEKSLSKNNLLETANVLGKTFWLISIKRNTCRKYNCKKYVLIFIIFLRFLLILAKLFQSNINENVIFKNSISCSTSGFK